MITCKLCGKQIVWSNLINCYVHMDGHNRCEAGEGGYPEPSAKSQAEMEAESRAERLAASRISEAD